MLIDAIYITDSDYCILNTTWHTNFQLQKTPRNKKRKRKIYLYEKMTEDSWKDFANSLNISFSSQQTFLPNIDKDNINKM